MRKVDHVLYMKGRIGLAAHLIIHRAQAMGPV